MVSFTGILKYSIYVFIAGWMFFLGILVGRGNSPVTFDTHKFQDRLQTIASEFGHKNEEPKKIELKFYDALEKPSVEGPETKQTSEIIPEKRSDITQSESQTKISLKKQTFNPNVNMAKTKPTEVKKQPVNSTPVAAKPVKPDSLKSDSAKPELEEIKQSGSGRYTIQVAAFKDFKDAVTFMAILEKKGFSAYRQKTDQNGIIWYRVRIGSFHTYDDAKKFKVRLDKARIDSMIMKKEANENIKG